MDPLSISAGVVGFLGFVVQVTHLVSKIKSAVQQFKSATMDVETLIGKLGIIEIICEMVKVNLESRQETLDAPPPAFLCPLSKALERCHETLKRLDQALSKFMDPSQPQGPSTKRPAQVGVRHSFVSKSSSKRKRSSLLSWPWETLWHSFKLS